MNPTKAEFLRRGRLLGAVLVMVTLAFQLLTPEARAQTVAQKRAQAARLADELERLEERMTVAAERVNAARLRADGVRRQVSEAEHQMRLADQRAVQVKAQLRDAAVTTYMHGGQPLGHATSSGDSARANAYVRALAASATDAIDAMRAVKINLGQRRQELLRTRAAADAALAAVRADERAAASADREVRATLARVRGDLATLLAAEQSRRTTRYQTQALSRPNTEKFGPVPGVSPGASAAVNYARAQIGKPYRWGGTGPDSFDCSGLTYMSWRAGGVTLPRTSQAQYRGTTRIPLSSVQPGDLIFYYSDIHHVGIYEGGGQIIAATSTGSFVKRLSMYYTTPVGAGRVG